MTDQNELEQLRAEVQQLKQMLGEILMFVPVRQQAVRESFTAALVDLVRLLHNGGHIRAQDLDESLKKTKEEIQAEPAPNAPLGILCKQSIVEVLDIIRDRIRPLGGGPEPEPKRLRVIAGTDTDRSEGK